MNKVNHWEKSARGGVSKPIRALLSLVLACAFMWPAGAVPQLAFAADGDTFADEATRQGDGSEASPYQLSTEADLIAFADALSVVVDGTVATMKSHDTTYDGKYFKLMNDIALTQAWKPIGLEYSQTASPVYFAGIFDGNGKTISNVSYSQDTNASARYVAFFGTVQATKSSNTVIKNLKLAGNAAGEGFANGSTSTTSATGSIVGRQLTAGTVTNHVEIENCVVDMNVSGSRNVGGIVGQASADLRIIDCLMLGDVFGTNAYVGGFAGQVSASATVANSLFLGSVTGNDTSSLGDAFKNTVNGVVGKSGATSVETANKNYVNVHYGSGQADYVKAYRLSVSGKTDAEEPSEGTIVTAPTTAAEASALAATMGWGESSLAAAALAEVAGGTEPSHTYVLPDLTLSAPTGSAKIGTSFSTGLGNVKPMVDGEEATEEIGKISMQIFSRAGEEPSSDDVSLGDAKDMSWNSYYKAFQSYTLTGTAPSPAGTYTCYVKLVWTVDGAVVATKTSPTWKLEVADNYQLGFTMSSPALNNVTWEKAADDTLTAEVGSIAYTINGETPAQGSDGTISFQLMYSDAGAATNWQALGNAVVAERAADGTFAPPTVVASMPQGMSAGNHYVKMTATWNIGGEDVATADSSFYWTLSPTDASHVYTVDSSGVRLGSVAPSALEANDAINLTIQTLEVKIDGAKPSKETGVFTVQLFQKVGAEKSGSDVSLGDPSALSWNSASWARRYQDDNNAVSGNAPSEAGNYTLYVKGVWTVDGEIVATCYSEEWDLAVTKTSKLTSALKNKSDTALVLSSDDESKWSAVDASDFDYIQTKTEKASVTATVNGAGWLIFDWKFDEKGAYTDKVNLTVDGVENPNAAPNRSYDWFTSSSVWGLGANSSSSVRWNTIGLQLDGEGPHTVMWTRAGSGDVNACLGNIRFTDTMNKSIQIGGDDGVQSAKLVVLDEDHKTESTGSEYDVETGVRPYGVVSFAATLKPNQKFLGWKANVNDDEYVSTSNPYRVRVFDEPLSLYAVTELVFEEAGTEGDPIQIKTLADLEKLASAVNSGMSLSGQYVQLQNDIDADGAEFAGIGTASNAFAGTFDGNGKTISNIKLTGQGLFNVTADGCTIENLAVDGALTASADKAGIVAGSFRGTMKSVKSSGTVASSKNYVGGVVGALEMNGAMTGCSSDAAVKPTYSGYTEPVAGGVVGDAGSMTSISNSKFTGTIEAGEVASVIGGIVGRTGSTTVSCCIVEADVSGRQHVGGIVGYTNSAALNLSDCEFRGSVSGVTNVGGIIGYLYGPWNAGDSTPKVTSCVATGTVKATGTDGNASGIAGYAERSIELNDCLALQEKVDGDSAARIAVKGTTNAASILLGGNAAWAGMLVEGEAVADDAASAVANGTDGASISADALVGESVPEAFALGDAWNITAGKKPQLKAFAELSGDEYPSYVLAQTSAGKKAAADAGAAQDLISKLPDASKVTMDDEAAINKAAAAYDDLSDAAKALVSADAKKKLDDAKTALAAAKKNAADAAANAPIGGVKAGQTETAGSGDSAAAYQVAVPATKKAPGEVYYKASKANKKAKKATVPDTVTIKGGAYKVVGVKANAFKGYKKLAQVTIGANVSKIEAKAFVKVPALKKLVVKSTLLAKKASVKGAFKGAKLKKALTVKAPKKVKKAYKKSFAKANLKANKKVTVK